MQDDMKYRNEDVQSEPSCEDKHEVTVIKIAPPEELPSEVESSPISGKICIFIYYFRNNNQERGLGNGRDIHLICNSYLQNTTLSIQGICTRGGSALHFLVCIFVDPMVLFHIVAN